MTEGERKMGDALRAVAAVSKEEVEEFIAALERQGTTMPFLDPTTYLHRGGAAVTAVALELARAFRDFRMELDRIRERAGDRFPVEWLKFFAAHRAAAGGGG